VVDLAAWVATLALVFGIAYALKLAGASTALRIWLGEPLEMIALLVVTTQLLRRRGERWADLGLRRPASAWRAAGLVVAGLIATYGANAVLVLVVFPALHIPRPDVGVMALVDGAPTGYATMLALTWTTVAFGEELQFRGFIFSRLETLFGRCRAGTFAAWLGQGLLFGGMHGYQGLGGMLATSTIGLVFGGVYLAGRRNMTACIVLHGMIDSFALTALFYAVTHGFHLS
jgi:hypothetical protein